MSEPRLRPYYVFSPEYQTYPAGWMEPPEYGADYVEVEAQNKREAVRLAVKKILSEQNRSYAEYNRSDGVPPFAGYRAELAVCPHGSPYFIVVNGKPVYTDWCWGCKEISATDE